MLHRPLRDQRLKGRRISHAPHLPLPSTRHNFFLDALAALLLAASVTMVTDFSRRVIGANPDELGIFAVSVQAVFSVAATGTFTKAGWQWIETLLAKIRIRSTSQSLLRLVLSAVFFAVVCPTWIWAPSGLATYDNYWGLIFAHNNNPSKALSYLERSIALDPRISAPHYNLGELLENSYQYDQAISQYKQAIALNQQDLRSYSNLVRLLTISGNATIALRVADQAPTSGSDDRQGLAAIHAQKGFAEFQLGFPQAALNDAELSEQNYPNAASSCLLAEIYVSTKDLVHASMAWDQFNQMRGSAEAFESSAPPDCKLRSEDFYAKK